MLFRCFMTDMIQGREALRQTTEMARNELRLDIIYGDTDSIMINSRTKDLKAADKIANDVKNKINAVYKSTLTNLLAINSKRA